MKRTFLVDHGAHRKGEVLDLPNVGAWRKTLGADWMLKTAPAGAQVVGRCGAKPAEVFTDAEEAGDIIMTLRGRQHSTAWIGRQLGIAREAVAAIARGELAVDRAVLGRLRELLAVVPPGRQDADGDGPGPTIAPAATAAALAPAAWQAAARREAGGLVTELKKLGHNAAWLAGQLGISRRGLEALEQGRFMIDNLLLNRLRKIRAAGRAP